jgi:hypothetical protein
MRSLPSLALALPALALLAPAAARAADFYTEADLGALIFIGPGSENADPGPAFGGRIGLGIFSWLSIGGVVNASTHQAQVPGPSVGQYFQLYQTGGELRLKVRAGSFGFFAQGGAGYAFISTNILDAVAVTAPDKHNGLYITGGGGLEYATENPRYAFGLSGAFTEFADFGSLQAVSVNIYLRYTK